MLHQLQGAPLACSVTTMAALATLTVCCSIASWMLALHRKEVLLKKNPLNSHFPPCQTGSPGKAMGRAKLSHLSLSLMPSNSSMQHSPPSANTRAPASSVHWAPSCTAAAVRPAADEARPVVMTARGLSLEANFMNCDFPARTCSLVSPGPADLRLPVALPPAACYWNTLLPQAELESFLQPQDCQQISQAEWPATSHGPAHMLVHIQYLGHAQHIPQMLLNKHKASKRGGYLCPDRQQAACGLHPGCASR
jgi:hypothetical protein